MTSLHLISTLAFALFVASATLKAQPDNTHSLPPPAPVTTGKPVSASASYSINSVSVDEPVIAMTFDDGPSGSLTPRLLDMLKERNMKATFFILGEMAEQNPDLLKRMVAEGHEVANHSWNHPQLTRLSPEAAGNQMSRTIEIITQATGKKPTLMRPPYGAINPTLTKRMNEEYGMKVVLWSVDPLDWKRPGPVAITNRIVQGAHPGAIILSHDIHPGTVEAMPATFDQLKAKGYRFVTVSELIAMDNGKGNNIKPVAAASPKATPTATDLIKAPISTSSPAPITR